MSFVIRGNRVVKHGSAYVIHGALPDATPRPPASGSTPRGSGGLAEETNVETNGASSVVGIAEQSNVVAKN